VKPATWIGVALAGLALGQVVPMGAGVERGKAVRVFSTNCTDAAGAKKVRAPDFKHRYCRGRLCLKRKARDEVRHLPRGLLGASMPSLQQ